MDYDQLLTFVVAINFISFIFVCMDKYYSKNRRYRISERTFFVLASIFGSLGILFGMYVCRHKTKKSKFIIFMPIMLLINIGILIFLYKTDVIKYL